jgi:AraC-like DNA-binding protein
VSASARTLARVFRTGTGMTFGQWRRLARLQAVLPRLASGHAVGAVAGHVGYQTASAFVAALGKETSLTPAAHFQTQRRAEATPASSPANAQNIPHGPA